MDQTLAKDADEWGEIYQEGFDTGRKGKPQTTNPYGLADWKGQAWLDGWNVGYSPTERDPVYDVVDWG